MRQRLTSSRRPLAVCLLILISASVNLSWGQSLKDSSENDSAPADQQRRPAQFRTKVDQVVVYTTVYDESGEFVSDLQQEDFALYEDRVQQEVTYFGTGDIPSTVGLVIDSSGSMRDKFALVNQAARLFLSMNNPKNELFLITFKDEVELAQDFTREVYDIHDALDNIIVSGGTALYDAVYLAVDKCREGSEPKKTVLVFTDGEDKDSYYSQKELSEKVQESDVQVYIVAFLDQDLSDSGGFFGIFKSPRDKIQKAISDVSASTGGRAFFPEKIDELNAVFASIALELRQQYALAYISSNAARDGQWREISVVVKEAKEKSLKVRAKKGYFAER